MFGNQYQNIDYDDRISSSFVLKPKTHPRLCKVIERSQRSLYDINDYDDEDYTVASAESDESEDITDESDYSDQEAPLSTPLNTTTVPNMIKRSCNRCAATRP